MPFEKCPDVRLASPLDETEIMRLMSLTHEENYEHPRNDEKVLAAIRRATERQGGICGVIGEEGKGLKGAILMFVVPIWYSDEYQLMEVVNFVDPDHRRSNYARQLIAFSKGCSETIGIDLMVGVFSSKRTEAKIRFYTGMLDKRGEFFSYRPKVEAI